MDALGNSARRLNAMVSCHACWHGAHLLELVQVCSQVTCRPLASLAAPIPNDDVRQEHRDAARAASASPPPSFSAPRGPADCPSDGGCVQPAPECPQTGQEFERHSARVTCCLDSDRLRAGQRVRRRGGAADAIQQRLVRALGGGAGGQPLGGQGAARHRARHHPRPRRGRDAVRAAARRRAGVLLRDGGRRAPRDRRRGRVRVERDRGAAAEHGGCLRRQLGQVDGRLDAAGRHDCRLDVRRAVAPRHGD